MQTGFADLLELAEEAPDFLRHPRGALARISWRWRVRAIKRTECYRLSRWAIAVLRTNVAAGRGERHC